MVPEVENNSVMCSWIGEGEKCRHPSMYNRHYCEVHHERVYMTMPEEMATYLIEKELKNE